MRRISRWWRQPDHFDWLSGYLHARDLTGPTQKLMAVISASLALVSPFNVLWGPAAVNESLAILLAVFAVFAGLGFAAMWLMRWPTERRSLAFAMTAIAFVALGGLNQANPLIGLMVCTALTISGGYLAFFHTAPYMVAHITVAAVVGAVAAVRLAQEENVILALWTYFLVVEVNLAVPLAIQIVVRALGIDLLQSDRDPLTGLLNAALVAVSRALRECTTETAVICRAGGEEFLVADIVADAAPKHLGQRLCDAVGSAPIPVTASVGTASTALRTVTTDDAIEVLHRLITDADAAMYAAKRDGGNRARYCDPPRPQDA